MRGDRPDSKSNRSILGYSIDILRVIVMYSTHIAGFDVRPYPLPGLPPARSSKCPRLWVLATFHMHRSLSPMYNCTPGLQAAVGTAEGMRMIPGLWDWYLSIPSYPSSPFEILLVTYSSCGIWTNLW